jgi:hypothetical protein
MELLRTQIVVLPFLLKDQFIPGLTKQRKARPLEPSMVPGGVDLPLPPSLQVRGSLSARCRIHIVGMSPHFAALARVMGRPVRYILLL